MLIFAGTLLLYAALMAITKDYKMLHCQAKNSVKPKNPEKYMVQLSKIVALWNNAVGAVAMVAGIVAVLWAGTKIIQKVL